MESLLNVHEALGFPKNETVEKEVSWKSSFNKNFGVLLYLFSKMNSKVQVIWISDACRCERLNILGISEILNTY